ncbi:hypothetical protein [Phnomibacter ginsenosidimutans]|uniref:Lipoprotein n=1 Tax=Phnomibacter ginsenosidimutans TaxID=2676868 RepID=A0A6I6GDK7_9BACT|nr:hypothetical protein [Phnomibacter ginsenosidimutans]QGW28410.1 hypothetical protein GLV81_10155 [Phnomibacter ginsenosidimutans]
MRVISLFLCLSFASCTFFDSPDKKMFIKSVQSDDLTVDWYIYSLISSFSPAKIQVEKDGNTCQIIEFGHYITDISLTSNVLTIQTSKTPEFDVDEDALKKVGLEIRLDTTGHEWNESTTRFGRLQRKQVDFSKRHFVDSYGTNFGD